MKTHYGDGLSGVLAGHPVMRANATYDNMIFPFPKCHVKRA